jgi:hypothetical protein
VDFGIASSQYATKEQAKDIATALAVVVQSKVAFMELLPKECFDEKKALELKSNYETFGCVVTIGSIETHKCWELAKSIKEGSKQFSGHQPHMFRILFLYWLMMNRISDFVAVDFFTQFGLFQDVTLPDFVDSVLD